MLKTGPDGALWIADMYRAVIEHPEWIPDDWEKRLDLRAGSEQGRLYRVYPIEKKPRAIPRLDKLDASGLVAALESPSGWQRDTAQRLLLHRREPEAIARLRALVRETKRPKTRVQAIWTLADLGQLDEPSSIKGLEDPDPNVRECAIAASSTLARDSQRVFNTLVHLSRDESARVRLQVALELGNVAGTPAGHALAALASRGRNDPWMRAAVMSSAGGHVGELLLAYVQANEGGRGAQGPEADALGPLLNQAVSGKDRAPLELIKRMIATRSGSDGQYAPWQFTAATALLEARDRLKIHQKLDLDASTIPVWQEARAIVADDTSGEEARIAATALVGYGAGLSKSGRADKDRDLLLGLLRPQVSVGLQMAAVAALGKTTDPKLADLLLHDWRRHSPQLRAVILDTLLSRTAWMSSLLSSLEDGCVPPAEIDPARRQRLMGVRNASLKARAERVFAHESRPRQAVVDTFRPALKQKGDAALGAVVFKKLCASCHRLGKEGVNVGPDLAALSDKSPEALLIAILDPNRAFETKYAGFSVATVDGRVLNGIIASVSATSVNLRSVDGMEVVLLRSQIEEMAASGQSLMPEGIEKDLKPGDLADLIAFLASSGAIQMPSEKP
jgi:putative heme-binding domain-containing protein